MLTRRHLAGVLGASLLAPGYARGVFAQGSAASWPTRHIRLIVPFAPGGATDVIARVIGNRLSELWGQQIVVENRSGGGSNVGAQVVATSEPDGYTLYIGSVPH